jgi:hypothetical protein
MTQDVLALLIQNEQKLHHAKTRSQKTLLEKLLHRDFFEIGRSGQRYDREHVIRALVMETDDQKSSPMILRYLWWMTRACY